MCTLVLKPYVMPNYTIVRHHIWLQYMSAHTYDLLLKYIFATWEYSVYAIATYPCCIRTYEHSTKCDTMCVVFTLPV